MTNTQDRTLVSVEQIDVPLSFYEWLGSIERDTLVHALTPHEQRALCAALASAPNASERGEVEREAFIEGLWAGWKSGLAGEQMDDGYAAKSWERSDRRAALKQEQK